MTRRAWSPDASTRMIGAWFWFLTTCLLAVGIAWEPTAQILAVRDYEADEKTCRRQHQEEAAKNYPSTTSDDERGKNRATAEREKEFREYCIQWRSAVAAERQSDIARWAAGVSFLALVAAGLAVVFARRTVDTMRTTAEKQLRAYVTAKPSNIEFSGRIPMVIHMEAKNTGQTPAYNVVMLNRFEFLPYPLPPDFDFGPDPPITETTNILAAGDVLPGNRPLGRPMGLEREAQLRDGTHRWYAMGIVRYRDAFGRPRTTRYCASAPGIQMLRGMGLVAGGAVDIQWEYTLAHNDAD